MLIKQKILRTKPIKKVSVHRGGANMVKIGIELVPERETMETVKYIKHAEENNFQYVWITDH